MTGMRRVSCQNRNSPEQITTAEPIHLRNAASAMPRDLRTIIHKAIDMDPARRYASAAALTEDLQRFLDDRPL